MTVPTERPPAPRSPAYRLYIDESGDHTYKKLDRDGHRYLALLGVWFRTKDDYPAFVEAIERLTWDIFGATPDDPIVLHRKEIVSRQGVFGVLADTEVNRRYEERFLRVIEDAKFTMACVMIDKRRHQESYSTPIDPYHYTLTCMIERYVRWLNDRATAGDVMAEVRGADQDLALQAEFAALRDAGTRWVNRAAMQRALTSGEIKFRKKEANVRGLQLADLLAHPMKVAALVASGRLPSRNEEAFGKEVARVATTKYRKSWKGRVDGYGLVWV
jgi:hypothetical protein